MEIMNGHGPSLKRANAQLQLFMTLRWDGPKRWCIEGNWKHIDNGRIVQFIMNDPIYTNDIGWDVYLEIQDKVWKL